MQISRLVTGHGKACQHNQQADSPIRSSQLPPSLQKQSLVPNLVVEATPFDKATNYQKFILNKLAYLQHLSQVKHSSSSHRRKNSSAHDRATLKLMAIIEGRDKQSPHHLDLSQMLMSKPLPLPNSPVLAKQRKSLSRNSEHPRPSTVGDVGGSKKRKTRLSLLYENRNYIRLEPCHIQAKPLSERPTRNQIAQTERVSVHNVLQPQHEITLQVAKPTVAPPSRSLKGMWIRRTVANRTKLPSQPNSPTKLTHRISPHHNEELKPWQSFQLQEI